MNPNFMFFNQDEYQKFKLIKDNEKLKKENRKNESSENQNDISE
jgi:hypothetical protein